MRISGARIGVCGVFTLSVQHLEKGDAVWTLGEYHNPGVFVNLYAGSRVWNFRSYPQGSEARKTYIN
jgi:hypothetical protein